MKVAVYPFWFLNKWWNKTCSSARYIWSCFEAVCFAKPTIGFTTLEGYTGGFLFQEFVLHFESKIKNYNLIFGWFSQYKKEYWQCNQVS